MIVSNLEYFTEGGGGGVPSLLNFNRTNIDRLVSTGNLFTGEFYVECTYEYDSLHSSYSPSFGFLAGGQAFRVLTGSSATLVSMNTFSNLTYTKTTAINTIYTTKVRRDSSNNVWVSYDGGAETNIGVRSGNVDVRVFGYGQTSFERVFDGKLYGFNINGEEYDLTEGSGDTLTGSLGNTFTITTNHVDGLTYINDVMWEAL